MILVSVILLFVALMAAEAFPFCFFVSFFDHFGRVMKRHAANFCHDDNHSSSGVVVSDCQSLSQLNADCFP